MTVEQFFTHYAALSMGDDDRALAAVYAPRFFVAAPTGSMTFANDAQFLDWLAQVHTFNREHGMRALSPAAVRETLLSPLHVLAQVRWSARSDGAGRGIVARAWVRFSARSGGGNAGVGSAVECRGRNNARRAAVPSVCTSAQSSRGGSHRLKRWR
jgi:hypothetical protein